MSMLSKTLTLNVDGMDGEESDSCNSGVRFAAMGLLKGTTSPLVHKQRRGGNFQQYS